jgi:FKBP-type peptidyl-prolyl cis-trans isomerase FkpA
MKNTISFFSLAFLILSLQGCIKTNNNGQCTDKLVTSETAAMQAYATNHGITPTVHPSGMMYQVINPGSGTVPTTNSKIFITYTGKLAATDAVFDSKSDPSLTGWYLNALIPAWQLGIPLIAKGGTIKLIIPSSLAYGCSGYGTIPGDAILYFEITLVDVQ